MRRTILFGNVSGSNRSGANVAVNNPLNQVEQLAHISGIVAMQQVFRDGGIERRRNLFRVEGFQEEARQRQNILATLS